MAGKEKKSDKMRCYCPYCEAELGAELSSFCKACKVEILYCSVCRRPLPKAAEVCPECGALVKGENG